MDYKAEYNHLRKLENEAYDRWDVCKPGWASSLWADYIEAGF